MRKLLLSQGKFALVDNEDYLFLNQWKWYFNQGYARRNSKRIKGEKRNGIFLQNVVITKEKNQEIDHINGNTLDNRKINLRICSHFQNSKNRKKQINNTSGYKGVTKDHKKWMAQILINYKRKYLGRFNTKKEAALAYNKAAKFYHGEFASLNDLPLT
jgi:hypothetical protein